MKIEVQVKDEGTKSTCTRCVKSDQNRVSEFRWHDTIGMYVATEAKLPKGWVEMSRGLLLCPDCKDAFGVVSVHFFEEQGNPLPSGIRRSMLEKDDD